MKLLDPQTTQETENAQIARGLLRLGEMEKLEKEWRMKLAQAEADFNDTLAKNRKVWEEEEAAHNARKREMETELSRVQELTELLEDKLDAVGEREQAVIQAEKALKAREMGVAAQEESVKAQARILTEKMAGLLGR